MTPAPDEVPWKALEQFEAVALVGWERGALECTSLDLLWFGTLGFFGGVMNREVLEHVHRRSRSTV